MPSPKAVLRDIHTLGLDPKKAYKQTTSSGRLSGVAADHKGHGLAVVKPVLKSALVSMESTSEPTVEKLDVNTQPVEPTTLEQHDGDEQNVQQAKKDKKAKKKEKTEESA